MLLLVPRCGDSEERGGRKHCDPKSNRNECDRLTILWLDVKQTVFNVFTYKISRCSWFYNWKWNETIFSVSVVSQKHWVSLVSSDGDWPVLLFGWLGRLCW